jgi:ABC-type multidrug transport system fused ATPase/permease subunit
VIRELGSLLKSLLLNEFYDSTSEAVYIDGQDIRSISVDRLRIPTFLGTIAFNISLGAAPGQVCSREDIIETCKKCSVHDFILPDDYDTEIGNNSKNLS